MSKRKVTEIFEDKLVAEIYEKIRDRDGKRFYDTVIQRQYFVDNVERRTNFFQKADMLSMHVIAVKVERWISTQLWQNRGNPGGARDVEPDTDEDSESGVDDAGYIEAD